ncbi:MAG: bifunctional methylenetetrahydrofolate dehydrogenase/methenyltetrahydrofolate cyclohydrolase FolD [Ignavibacteriales bacterium]|nr:bifunctional methylenetetrahydrofolate dehydrogenase/methenyltetrahydrofolate cyclohydrolase FolD [Ignavibacteriales bacterium]MCF8315196.1 bifunctional methylenetetrahydrofolate dehydrogenase/methenyltetrahydrofolate cyclohydrolase FolD [Ignavibacteriales bacterium]MCF8438471.1 bifunctional methylenetetrahydrofolate dehydrogenase/methenyltetrahydrofolate cyclohydrolase FolD [Ignavibacteriales bacterium]
MILLDGNKTAAEIKNEIAQKVARIREEGKKSPGLVTILVGDNPASQVYVNKKNKTCAELGMISKTEKLDAGISEDELLKLVRYYNDAAEYHGILVQLPLPAHIDEDKVIEAINPAKDVDGFHPVSVGNLVIGKEAFLPCTPFGILELLKRYNIETKGKHVVVVGRSNIVGKPVANLLLQKKEGANAVVTVCHSAAPDLKKFTLSADILIAAIGRANYVTADMVKDGAVVIDVGINRVEDHSAAKGYRIVGDVDFENVAPKCSYITPVPGGVGAMTIAMLMQNTLSAYIKIEEKK